MITNEIQSDRLKLFRITSAQLHSLVGVGSELTRAERRELQTLLSRRGYDIGPVDGAIGEKTRQAIADVQTKAGMPRDGRPGTKLLNLLRAGQ